MLRKLDALLFGSVILSFNDFPEFSRRRPFCWVTLSTASLTFLLVRNKALTFYCRHIGLSLAFTLRLPLQFIIIKLYSTILKLLLNLIFVTVRSYGGVTTVFISNTW